MKGYIIVFLLFFSVGCSNLLKEENLVNNREFYYYKGHLAKGKLLIEGTDQKVIKTLDKGQIKNIFIDSKEYMYSRSLLETVKDENGHEYSYRQGELVEIDGQKVMPEILLSHFPESDVDDSFDSQKEYDKGLIKSITYFRDKTEVLLSFDSFGIIKKKLVKKNGNIKYRYEYGREGILLNIYKVNLDGKSERVYTFADGNYKFTTYMNGCPKLEEIYNSLGNLCSTLKYINQEITSYYEYYPQGSIKILGYLDKNMNKIGRWTYFYENGNTMEFRDYSQKDIAYFNKYYESGMKMLSGKLQVANNKYIGPVKEYYLNGQLKAIEEYSKDGKIIEGRSKYYDEKGFETVKVN